MGPTTTRVLLRGVAAVGSLLAGCAGAAGDLAPSTPVTVTVSAPAEAPPPPVASATPAGPPPVLHVFAEGWNLRAGITRGIGTLFDTRPGNVGELVGDSVRVTPGALAPLLSGPRTIVDHLYGSQRDLWAILPVDPDGPSDPFGLVARRLDTAFRVQRTMVSGPYNQVFISPGNDPSPYVFLHEMETGGGTINRVDQGVLGSPLSPSDLPALAVDGRLSIVGTTATPTGYIAVLGEVSNEKHLLGEKMHYGIQRWGGGMTRGKVTMVPDPPPGVVSLDVVFCLSPSGTVHVVRDLLTRKESPGKRDLDGYAELASWNGQGWTTSRIPESTAYFLVKGCAVAADDTVWIAWRTNTTVHGDDVRLDRFANGTWARVPVPRLAPRAVRRTVAFDRGQGRYVVVTDPVPPPQRAEGVLHVDRIWADEASTIWLGGERLERGQDVATGVYEQYLNRLRVLVRAGPAPESGPIAWEEPLVSDALAFAAQTGNAALKPVAPKALPLATRECSESFVVILDSIPDTTPLDYAFPDLVAPLKGALGDNNKVVEARMGDKIVFGVIAGHYDQAKKIAERATATSKGKHKSAPILCGKPAVTREVVVE